LFIQLDKQVANFNAIRSTRGIGSFVRFGLNQATIDDGIVNAIKKRIACQKQDKTLYELAECRQGDSVELTEGGFEGLKAIYQAKSGVERSVLMVKMLGQERQVIVQKSRV
jgi:transcriptional antiterminator RfaH